MTSDDDLHEAVLAVYAAWTVPGPQPVAHRRAQLRLEREWPTLAVAVHYLVRCVEPPSG